MVSVLMPQNNIKKSSNGHFQADESLKKDLECSSRSYYAYEIIFLCSKNFCKAQLWPLLKRCCWFRLIVISHNYELKYLNALKNRLWKCHFLQFAFKNKLLPRLNFLYFYKEQGRIDYSNGIEIFTSFLWKRITIQQV